MRYYLNPKMLIKKAKGITKNPNEFTDYVKSTANIVKNNK